MLGEIGNRFTSSSFFFFSSSSYSTGSHHDLMNYEVVNNRSLKIKNSPHKLRSKFGSIFGKNFLNTRKSQSSISKYGNGSINESLNSVTIDVR